MIRILQIKLPIEHTEKDLKKKVSQILKIQETDILQIVIKKKSLDARKKPHLFFLYQVDVSIKREDKLLRHLPKDCVKTPDEGYVLPACDHYVFSKKPIIIGAGPAGLFCAYILSLCGIQALVIERGSALEKRVQTIEKFWETGVLDPETNVQFGEGGAGTFSDGKLNTLVKDKTGKNQFVLETFVKFGAPEHILYDAKPHIGTDILRKVIINMRNFMIEKGTTFLFDTKMTNIIVQENRIRGVVVADGTSYFSDHVVIAIGHSARDTFETLYDQKIDMMQKSFAIGLRVEHPRTFINKSQYGMEEHAKLQAASYKLTAQTSQGRGVYSFCMCPGGYVVNASSEANRLAINGMSYSGRNGDNSNSAVIVTVTPEDFISEHPLAGVWLQRELEEKAFQIGQGMVPVECFGDFEKAVREASSIVGKDSSTEQERLTPDNTLINGMNHSLFEEFAPCIKGKYTYAPVHDIMPKVMNEAFVEGMHQFGMKIRGFDAPETLLSGIESRTSSPVRIARNTEGYSTSLTGLYPCGEGAGYAGGIMSAAMDGITIAEKMIENAKGEL